MRFLLLSSCILVLAGCNAVYKNLQPTEGSVTDLFKISPSFNNVLYKANVNVIGHYLSGLLLIKRLPDSSTRVVFSSEMGFKFFDFGFTPRGDFSVFYIIPQMDKKPVIKTLRKDFELIMLTNHDTDGAFLRRDSNSYYYIFPKPKGFYCYLTDKENRTITRMEISSSRRAIVQAFVENYNNGFPDTIGISHKNFNFTIGLKRIER